MTVAIPTLILEFSRIRYLFEGRKLLTRALHRLISRSKF
jgi:hypothetical protein